ncbi:MAG TPA: glycosyltransferase family 2 protein, partial [Candidatus Saccharibacteria bacterium]|nr:glycosyltransferase family 2 protein [Candidatus Saccharibacteria bacterium]
YTANFESALGEATGRYIFLSDQDDVWLPGKVDATLCALRSSDLVISDCFTTDTNLKVLSKSRFEDFNIKEGFFRHLIKSRYIGCCMAFRSELLRVVLPFPSRHDLVEPDPWISSVAELYFRVHLIREPLILYRRHDSNTSLGGLGKGYPLSNKVYRRGYRLLALARRRSAARRLALEMLD